MKKILKETLNSLIEEREITQYPPCPDCGSEVVLRTSSRGQQEYLCKNKNCLRSFSESTKDQPRRTNLNNPPCPDCGSLKVHKRGIDAINGSEKYTCYECLKSFRKSKKFNNIEIEKPLSQEEQESKFQYPPCPDCGSAVTRSLGYTKTG